MTKKKSFIEGVSEPVSQDSGLVKSRAQSGGDDKGQKDQKSDQQERDQKYLDSEVPTDDSRYVRAGLLFLLITLGSFAAWATFAPLSSALVTSGEVMVDSYRKSIQHFEGGIVKNIYVRNGDVVDAGDPLVQLDTTQAEADYDAVRTRLFSTMAELERLRAEQSLSKTLVYSEPLLVEAEKDRDIAGVIEQQAQLHAASVSAFMQEQKALASQGEQIEEQVIGLLKQQPVLQEQLDSLETEQEAFATLFEEGLGDSQRARELKRQMLQKRNELARNESEIARLKIQRTETDLQQAQRKQGYLKQIGQQLRQVQADYFDLKERMNVSLDRLNRATIRAPERGVVVDMQVHTVGGVAPSGQTLLDLVPEKDKFVIETRVNTQDINDIYKGQLADIRFSAFNQRKTKVIEGEVMHVSADRLLNERDGSPYYMARIRVTDQGREDMSEGMELRPGMPAEVMIKRGDRTLLSYILKPIHDGFARSLKEK